MSSETSVMSAPHSIWASLHKRLAKRPDSEHVQASIRIVISLIATAYVIFAGREGGVITPAAWHVLTMAILFISLSIVLLISIVAHPNTSVVRRVIGMLADIAMNTYLLYTLGETGVPFYGVYLWVAFGNGFRYGPRYLYIATALSVIGFVLVLFTNEYWITHRTMGMGLLTVLVVLTMYVANLVRQLNDRNHELRQLYEQMAKHATHDSLTGLPNRKYFHDHLAETITSAERDKKTFAMLFLDLDGFKAINDALGHGVGDQIIEITARRLERCIRKGDLVARVGGDEFIVLLRDIILFDVSKVAEKFIEALSEPFVIAGNTLRITISIGVAMYPQDGMDANALINNADNAMYETKRSGKNGYRIYCNKHLHRVSMNLDDQMQMDRS
jgi:diguanylate cyclase (GGDEF)-like protein